MANTGKSLTLNPIVESPQDNPYINATISGSLPHLIELFGRFSERCPPPSENSKNHTADSILAWLEITFGPYDARTKDWMYNTVSLPALARHRIPKQHPTLQMISDMICWHSLSENKLRKHDSDPNWKQVNTLLAEQITLLVRIYDKQLLLAHRNKRSPIGSATIELILYTFLFLIVFTPGFVCLIYGYYPSSSSSAEYVGPVFFKTTGILLSSYSETTRNSNDDDGTTTTTQLLYGYGGYANNTLNADGSITYIGGTHCNAIQASRGVTYTVGGSHDLLVEQSAGKLCSFPRRSEPAFIAGVTLLAFSTVMLIPFWYFYKQSRDDRKGVNAVLGLLWPDDPGTGSILSCCNYDCC